MTQEAPVQDQSRVAKRYREGYVLKDKMDKTIIVEITRIIQHKKFGKVVRQKIRYAVHDEKNEARNGDKVRIAESRPLSKRKRWRLVKVLESKGA